MIMKKTILPILFCAPICFGSVFAQTNKAFAITSEMKGTIQWNAVKELDLSTGNVVRSIYSPSELKNVVFNFFNEKGIVSTDVSSLSIPTQNGVAATAFDAKNNRLYFSQMWGNDLRYFDLNSNELSVVINQDKNYSTGVRNDESNVITRMTFASNGNGYAITNDGNQLIQFTTDSKPSVTNLGALIDSKKNNGISIHNQCTSWGGDVVADVYGNLYLFTAKNNVFKININTKVAEFIGSVKNIPTNFTINGAAVDTNGDIFVSSAISTENYYTINLSTLQAKPVNKTEAAVFNASDLANSNLAYQNTLAKPALEQQISNNNISVFPNPAVNNNFTLQFNTIPKGIYIIQLNDANGKTVVTNKVIINGLQNEIINLPKGISAGLFLLKVSDTKGKNYFSEKIIVQ
jgi:hypothetical protein